MAFIFVPALVFTLATFVLAALFRLGLAIFRRKAPGFWGRTLRWHAGLLALHLFVTVPAILGVLLSHAGTRTDEAGYAGPRLAADGTWLEQTRETLAAEREGKASVDPAVAAAAFQRAVKFASRDGVPTWPCC